MTRLSDAFTRGPALVAFVTAGDGPTADILDALVAGGADVIELGMPFTDPMADGPAIQAANIRSLAAGTTTAGILAIATGLPASVTRQVPLVLMGYANPMLRRGPEWFARAAADAGVDGVICVDVPPEEDDALGPALRKAGIDLDPPRHPDHRRPSPADRARWRVGFRLLRLGRRNHRQAAGAGGIDRTGRRPPEGRHRPAGRGRLRHPHAGAGGAGRAGRRWRGDRLGNRRDSSPQHGADAPEHVRAYIEGLSAAVRGARSAA